MAKRLPDIAITLPEDEGKYLDRDLKMATDVAMNRSDTALVDIQEYVSKGAHSYATAHVALTMTGFPCLVKAGAYAAFSGMYRLVSLGAVREQDIDSLEHVLIGIVKLAREQGKDFAEECEDMDGDEAENLFNRLRDMIDAAHREEDT